MQCLEKEEWNCYLFVYQMIESIFFFSDHGIWSAKSYQTHVMRQSVQFCFYNTKCSLLALARFTSNSFQMLFDIPKKYILGVLGHFPPFSLWLISVISSLLLPILKGGQLCSTGTTSDNACQRYHGHCSPKWLRLLGCRLLYTLYIENVKAQSH